MLGSLRARRLALTNDGLRFLVRVAVWGFKTQLGVKGLVNRSSAFFAVVSWQPQANPLQEFAF